MSRYRHAALTGSLISLPKHCYKHNVLTGLKTLKTEAAKLLSSVGTLCL